MQAEMDEDVLAVPPFTPENWAEQLMKALVSLNLPFKSIEDHEFRMAFLMLNGQVTIPGATTMRNRLDGHFERVKQQLKDRLAGQSKVSLALDCWTSPNHLAFMAVMGYYIT